MRWARYESEGKPHHGIVEGDRIIEIEGTPFGAHKRTGRDVDLAGARLLPPVMPGVIYCAGRNYPGHLATGAQRLPDRASNETAATKKADINHRTPASLTGSGQPIIVPRESSGKVRFEGELAVVIGKDAKHMTLGNAMSCVFGYTICNDVTEESWQKSDRTGWRAKNADTFNPLGPWIETDVDPEAMITRVRLNGKQVSEFKTSTWLVGIAEYIRAITAFATLHPGDIILMGTEDPVLPMEPGDVCEIDITGIGTLTNPLVAER